MDEPPGLAPLLVKPVLVIETIRSMGKAYSWWSRTFRHWPWPTGLRARTGTHRHLGPVAQIVAIGSEAAYLGSKSGKI